MYKKLISSILIVALLNLLGCYSIKSFTGPELKQVEEKEDKPDDIYVKTKDHQEYHFSDSNFYIENDTLYVIASVKGQFFEEKIALREIRSIQLENFKYHRPSLMTVSEYQKIELESGKPNEIYLTKTDFTKYHFMKLYYYIENDTLYGMGKVIIDRIQLDRKIALSDIESIEVKSVNWAATILLVLGIGTISFVTFAVIFIIINPDRFVK